ncbi:ArsR/SmtB family transcription factor [Natronorubrum sp. DTA7]|uniref:ArsR/SmtB family transcription factor n=1 Tax=Natronorubrum sp. DTA7 TaxID=3447016 RepID=UPI003F87F726
MARNGTSENSTPSTDELLELLGDRYARRVLQTILDEPMAVQQIVETTGISKPTAYRRLDQLERAGLVASKMLLDTGGNHYKQYWTTLESVTLRIGEDGVTTTVRTDRTQRSRERRLS